MIFILYEGKMQGLEKKKFSCKHISFIVYSAKSSKI